MTRESISPGMILYQINPYEVPDAIRVVRWRVLYVKANTKGEGYARLERVGECHPKATKVQSVPFWTMEAKGFALTQEDAEHMAMATIERQLDGIEEHRIERHKAHAVVRRIALARLDSEDMAAQAVAE